MAGCFEDFGSTSSSGIFSQWFIHVKAIFAAMRGTFSQHAHDNKKNYFFNNYFLIGGHETEGQSIAVIDRVSTL